MQGLEQLLRMWGVSPGSQRWQDMMRDFERGQTLFNQVPHQDPSKDKMAAQECLHGVVWSIIARQRAQTLSGQHFSWHVGKTASYTGRWYRLPLQQLS